MKREKEILEKASFLFPLYVSAPLWLCGHSTQNEAFMGGVSYAKKAEEISAFVRSPQFFL
jgi:hypothetical protein